MILAEEFAKAGVPTGGPNDGFGIQMLGNTLLQWGTEEQKRALPAADPVRRGHVVPGLLRARTPAPTSATSACGPMLDGDQWVLNGQKIWTSAGHLADHIFTLARTDPDAPKHKGISFLLVDMRQPGIEVRPIKMISGESEFNEVFYTDATCPKDEVVGGVNNGWAVAMTLLGYERGEAAATVPDPLPGRARPAARRWPRSAASTDDPVIRQRLAWCYGKVQIMRYLGHAHADPVPRRPPARARRRRSPSCTGASTTRWSPSWRSTSSAPTRWCPTGRQPSSAFQTDDAGAPNSLGVVGRHVPQRPGRHDLRRLAQIQRNIIGEMVLGLPKEPAAEPVDARRRSVACGRRRARPRAVADRACASGGAPRRRAGGGGGRSCRVPSRRVPAVPAGDPVRRRRSPPDAADVLNYLAWCRRAGDVTPSARSPGIARRRRQASVGSPPCGARSC